MFPITRLYVIFYIHNKDYNIWEDSSLHIHSYLQFSVESHRPNMLTTTDTRRDKASSLFEKHWAQQSAGPASQDTKTSLCFSVSLPSPSSGAELFPSNLSNALGRYSLAEVRMRQGARGQVAQTHPLCWFATGPPVPRNLQEPWVTLLPPDVHTHVQSRDSVWEMQTSNVSQNHASNFSHKSRSCGGFCLPALLSRMWGELLS